MVQNPSSRRVKFGLIICLSEYKFLQLYKAIFLDVFEATFVVLDDHQFAKLKANL